MFPSTDPVRCYSSVTQQWKLQTASCWQSSATVGYCWWSNNELRRLLVAINCTSVFLGWCLQRLNDSISGWLMDRAKNWTTKLRQLLIQSSRYCAARLQLLSLHDQSDTPVSLDLFDVFQWHADGSHCVHLEPFSRLTGAHSQTHSFTAIINTIGLLTTGTVGSHALIRLVFITLADDQLLQSPVK